MLEFLDNNVALDGGFRFSQSQLAMLMDPDDLHLLNAIGGLQALSEGLHTDPRKGILTTPDSSRRGDVEAHAEEIYNIAQESSADERTADIYTPSCRGRTQVSSGAMLEDRIRAFGANTSFSPKRKKYFHYFRAAYHRDFFVCPVSFANLIE